MALSTIILICCCVFLVAANPDGRSESTRVPRDNHTESSRSTGSPGTRPTEKPQDCSREDIQKLASCCKLPQVFPAGLIENCSYTLPTTKAPGSSGSKKRGSKRSKRAPPKGSKLRDPTCVSDCLLRSQGLISGAGVIDIGGLGNLINSNASAVWVPVLNATITGCFANLTNVSNSVPPPPKEGCVATSDLLLMCIQRGLLLGCPSSELTTNTTCKSIPSKLSKCDPFAAAKNYKPKISSTITTTPPTTPASGK
ncbi:uncharacterized protein LOC132195000 [Neocloeon triangulifer]|uniref:uncharacterized protein LOC132195000 n=1 Tax=Neocloeon triangulifer TaxID=2078957 RepID=UPI00286EF635|nr:uncharacterized protein LOC132195000 [Neocloeon triangulifer]